jgi:hypothetical protein
LAGSMKTLGPNASHQILIADQLSVAFKQSNQDFQRATSERWACRLPAKGNCVRTRRNGPNETSVGVALTGSVRFLKSGLAVSGR